MEREAQRFEKATKVHQKDFDDTKGVWLYDPTERLGNEGYVRSLAAALEEIEDSCFEAAERPTYLWICYFAPFQLPTAESILEMAIDAACEDHHEEIRESISEADITELAAAIKPHLDAFDAKQKGGSWCVGYTRALLLDGAVSDTEPAPPATAEV